MEDSTVIEVRALDIPSVAEVLNRLRAAVVLLGDIAQDSNVPPQYRQRIRIWREDSEGAVAAMLKPVVTVPLSHAEGSGIQD